MDKKYFGVAGQILSGKGTAAEFFVNTFDAEHLRFSKVLDDILNIMDLPISRINEQTLGVLVKELFGEDVLSKALISRAQKTEKKVVVFEGLRKKEELDSLKAELPGFKLIYLKAAPEIRYARMQKRNEKLGESTKTYEEFLESEKHDADKQITDLEAYADYIVMNETTKEDFDKALNKVVEEIL